MSLFVPPSCKDLFRLAGWLPGRRVAVDFPDYMHLRSSPLAISILQEFGGLHVGHTGAGRDQATSDVLFFLSDDEADTGRLDDRDEYLDQEFFPIARAHRGYLDLFLDESGRLFSHDLPSGTLVIAGNTFADGIERLLLGYRLETQSW